MNDLKEEKKEEKTKNVPVFSKEAILNSQEFKSKKDLIAVLLDSNKLYSKNDVYSVIKNYLKRSGF